MSIYTKTYSFDNGIPADGGQVDIELTNIGKSFDALGKGWVPVGHTCTYSAASSYVNTVTSYGGSFTVSGDVTSFYTVGARLKFTQPTDGVKYGIITKVAYSSPNTTVTLFLGTDYDMDNEAITDVFMSTARFPVGFPADAEKWRLRTTKLSDTRTNQASGSWVNNGLVDIKLPIGSWGLSYEGSMYASEAAATSIIVRSTLSTANNSESDSLWTVSIYNTGATVYGLAARHAVLNLAADDTLYLNLRGERTGGGGDVDSVGWIGDNTPTVVDAMCMYY